MVTATAIADAGVDAGGLAPSPAPLYMIRADIDFREFHRWVAVRGLYGSESDSETAGASPRRRRRKGDGRRGRRRGDAATADGVAMHKLLRESFGELAPQPFRIIAPKGGSRGSLYGYAAADAATLRAAALDYACPLQAKALPAALIDSKLMLAEWNVGRRLGFEILIRPVARADGERDVFQRLRARLADEAGVDEGGDSSEKAMPGREDAYAAWLAARLERGGARLESARLEGFSLTRLWRMPRGGPVGPHALMRGALTIVDAARFSAALAQGIGRHKAYGYGMLLLRPYMRSDIRRHSTDWRADAGGESKIGYENYEGERVIQALALNDIARREVEGNNG